MAQGIKSTKGFSRQLSRGGTRLRNNGPGARKLSRTSTGLPTSTKGKSRQPSK